MIMTLQEEIKMDVVKHLKWDSRLDASKINVKVEDRKVILEGEVPSYSSRMSAFDDAWNVSGVKAVKNNLTVKYPDVDLPSDEEINERLRNKILWHSDLSITEIEFEIEDSWVTIEGTVDSYWKKLEVENTVEDVSGVLGITNKLAVVPADNVTDEIIAEDIVDAIDRSKNVFVDNVDVEVQNGKVTLTGTVNDYKARNAAFEAALYTTGVVEVEDLMDVRELEITA